MESGGRLGRLVSTLRVSCSRELPVGLMHHGWVLRTVAATPGATHVGREIGLGGVSQRPLSQFALTPRIGGCDLIRRTSPVDLLKCAKAGSHL